MSREIKFRAWLKDDKTMKFVDIIDWNSESISFTELIPIKESNPEYDEIEVRFDKVELMQYTGLKDKDGTEIYEGDIVKIDNEIYRVFYNEGSFRVIESESHLEHGRLFELMSMSDRTYCEVIGNIHQNGDLLDGCNS